MLPAPRRGVWGREVTRLPGQVCHSLAHLFWVLALVRSREGPVRSQIDSPLPVGVLAVAVLGHGLQFLHIRQQRGTLVSFGPVHTGMKFHSYHLLFLG